MNAARVVLSNLFMSLLLVASPPPAFAQSFDDEEASGEEDAGDELTPETLAPEDEPAPRRVPVGEEPPWPRKGLMIAGWATLGGGYLFSALVGLQIMQQDLEAESNSNSFYREECLNCDETGPYMLIPLVGPFLAMPAADGTDGKVVCALMGAVQVTGLVLGIVGTSMFTSDRARYRQWEKRNSGQFGKWYVSSAMAPLGDGQQVPALFLGTAF